MPTISVIIPTYNSSKYIFEAINSVMVQTQKDYEIIIVDDGSTDNTNELVKLYIKSQPCIRYLYQQNQGPGAARNRGIREAKGEYIVFLDADDLIPIDSLKRKIQFLIKYPKVNLVFSDYYMILEDSFNKLPVLLRTKFIDCVERIISYRKTDEIIFNNSFLIEYLKFTPHPIFTGTVMLRKKTVEEVGFFRTDIFIGEDVDYWVRVSKKHTVGFINQPLSYYRHSLSNLTNQKERYKIETIKLYMDLGKDNKDKNINGIIRIKLSQAYFELGYYYKSNLLIKKARKNLISSIFYNPFNINPYRSFLGTFLTRS